MVDITYFNNSNDVSATINIILLITHKCHVILFHYPDLCTKNSIVKMNFNYVISFGNNICVTTTGNVLY